MVALDQYDDANETRPYIVALIAQIMHPITRIASQLRVRWPIH